MQQPTLAEIEERLQTITKVHETWKGNEKYKRCLEIEIFALNFLLVSLPPDV